MQRVESGPLSGNVLDLRSSPLDRNTLSPSKLGLLNGRKYRNTLPTRDTISHDENCTLLRKRLKSRTVYDNVTSCKKLPQLHANDNVRVQDSVFLKRKTQNHALYKAVGSLGYNVFIFKHCNLANLACKNSCTEKNHSIQSSMLSIQ